MLSKVWDYLSVCGILVLPLLVGIYHGVRGNPNLPYSFVFGHKEISLFKTSLSTAALSIGPVILFLLFELENSEGFTWVLAGIGYLIALVVVVAFIAPILHYGRSPSIFQYLEERYRSKYLKNFSVLIFSIVTVLLSSAVLSISASLLAQTIPIQSWLLAVLIGTVTTFSVITGGLGASIDLNFVLFILFGTTTFAVSIGLAYLKSPATISGVDLNVDFDAFSHAPNVFIVIPFSFVTAMQILGTSQILYQNFAPAVTKRRARLSLALSSPLVFFVGTLCVLTGILVRHLFSSCHIQSAADPYVNLDRALRTWTTDIPALKGALIGGVITFGICFMASSALGMATVLWEDLLSPRLTLKKEKRQVLAVQVLITTISLIITTIAAANLALVEDSWRFHRQIFILAASIMTPVSAIFLAGMFFPCCNSKGASLALCLGLLFTIAFGAGNLALRVNQRTDAFEGVCPPTSGSNSTPFPPWVPTTQRSTLIPSTSASPVFSTTSELTTTTGKTAGAAATVPSVVSTAPSKISSTESTTDSTTSLVTTPPTSDSLTTTSISTTVTPTIIITITPPITVQTAETTTQNLVEEANNATEDSLLVNSTVEFINAFQKKSSNFLSVRSEETMTPPPSTDDPAWVKVFRISVLFHPILGLLLTLLLTLLLSLATGGQDIYALDWNLVYWTCNNCTQRLTYGGNTTLQRRRKPRFNKAPYVHSESFRYARHGPLPESSYRNPRVSQFMESTMQTRIEDDLTPSSSDFGKASL